MNATRNKKGEVSVSVGGSAYSCKIPKTCSMLGILATNGMINGGDYREDGYVYVNGERDRKWHSKINNIRIWKPKLKDIKALYRLYKKVNQQSDMHWKKIKKVLQAIYNTLSKEDKKAANPRAVTHTVPRNYQPNGDIWEYVVSKFEDGRLGYSFDWVKLEPNERKNAELGQELNKLDDRNHDLQNRAYKVTKIFHEALRQQLPPAEENMLYTFKFGKDTFSFRSSTGGYSWWKDGVEQINFVTKKVM